MSVLVDVPPVALSCSSHTHVLSTNDDGTVILHTFHHDEQLSSAQQHAHDQTHAQSSAPPSHKSPNSVSSSPAKASESTTTQSQTTPSTFFLFGGCFFSFVSLGYMLTGLIHDSWVIVSDAPGYNASNNREVTTSRWAGKENLQWMYVGIGCGTALISAICIIPNIFGWRRTNLSKFLKLISIVCSALTAVFGNLAYNSYPQLPTVPQGNNITYLHGGGYDYTYNSFKYSIISMSALVVHEFIVRRIQALRILRIMDYYRTHRKHRQHAKKAAHNKQQHTESSGIKRTLSFETADAQTKAMITQMLLNKDRLSGEMLKLLLAFTSLFYVVQIGALIYSHIEGWELRRAVNFCVVTIATIGFGDTVPVTNLGRGLLFVYFPIGFITLSYCINLLFKHLIYQLDRHVRLVCAFIYVYILSRWCACCGCTRRQPKRADQSYQSSTAAATNNNEVELQSPHASSNNQDDESPQEALSPTSASIIQSNQLPSLSQIDAAWADDLLAQLPESWQMSTERTTAYQVLFISSLLLIVMLGGAAVFYSYEPHWTYGESIYFTFITLTTIGYGDFSPTTPESMSFFPYYIIIGLGVLTYALSLIGQHFEKKIENIQATDKAKSADTQKGSSPTSPPNASSAAGTGAASTSPHHSSTHLFTKLANNGALATHTDKLKGVVQQLKQNNQKFQEQLDFSSLPSLSSSSLLSEYSLIASSLHDLYESLLQLQTHSPAHPPRHIGPHFHPDKSQDAHQRRHSTSKSNSVSPL